VAEPLVYGLAAGGGSGDDLLRMPSDSDMRSRTNNLPRRLSSFVGRERERTQVAGALDATRLLTLTGGGGCGKTSLALEVARDALDRFPDGVFWVELAPLVEPAMAASALARAVGVRPLRGETELDAAVRQLASRRALVVLDNCEHLVQRCAEVAQSVLLACGDVTVMATSRIPLAIDGEADWRVPSLSLPASHDDLHAVLDSDAVRLFAERARLAHSQFSLDQTRLPAVTEICRRLDGIPLAIELAAARLRVLSVEQIASGLGDALVLVAGGTRTALPRHRTLRASIDWSHELLSDKERLLFRRLGVFLGGFTLQAAEEVCADDKIPARDLLGVLGPLVEQSLVQAEERSPAVRYRLLETIRQYALERLADAGEVDALRGRHRDVYLDVAERLAADIFGAGQPRVLAALDVEAANLSAAFEHAIATSGELALRLSVAIAPWWRHRARYQEAEDSYTRALGTRAGREPSLLRTLALSARAWVVSNSGVHERAVAYGEQALAEAEATGGQAAVIAALLALGNAQLFSDPRHAQSTLVRARQLALTAGDEWAVARSETLITIAAAYCQDADLHREYADGLPGRLARIGDVETLAAYWVFASYVEFVVGELARAREAGERGLAAAREIDEPNLQCAALMEIAWEDIAMGRAERARADLRVIEVKALERGTVVLPWLTGSLALAEAASGELKAAARRLEALQDNQAGGAFDALASATTVLGEVLRLLGDDRANAVAARALELAHSVDSRWYAARNTLTLGRLAAARREWAQAEHLHHEALDTILEQSFRLELPAALEALAEVACGLESHSEAARIFGAAERARRDLKLVAWPAQRADVTALTGRVREAMGEESFERAWSEGAELGDIEAVAWIRRARGERKRPSAGWESLTPTELEVARHAATGLTNPEIGARMFISRSTVKTHLAHVYAKLGIANRAQLAAEAERRR
jgi:predicted ATPase/DNA-binding CsgD family transcriptional regulator